MHNLCLSKKIITYIRKVNLCIIVWIDLFFKEIPSAKKEANYVLDHQSQSEKKIITIFTDSSVFILELGSGATGPCCNAPYMETNTIMTK